MVPAGLVRPHNGRAQGTIKNPLMGNLKDPRGNDMLIFLGERVEASAAGRGVERGGAGGSGSPQPEHALVPTPPHHTRVPTALHLLKKM